MQEENASTPRRNSGTFNLLSVQLFSSQGWCLSTIMQQSACKVRPPCGCIRSFPRVAEILSRHCNSIHQKTMEKETEKGMSQKEGKEQETRVGRKEKGTFSRW